MSSANLQAVAKLAEQAARAAGRLILEATAARASSGLRIESKGGVDLVTETDQLCEKTILALIRDQFPEHSIVAEESAFADGSDGLGDGPTWVIDPLDGTTNYAHGYPLVCVSIGFCVNRLPVVGVVYNPYLEKLYSAVQGQGAFCNGAALKCSSAAHIGEALVVNNIGASRDPTFVELTLNRLRHLLNAQPPLRGLRNSGSAAQNMAHVASGELDAYFEDGYGGPWDVAAGYVLVTEAGGHVCDPLSGEAFKLEMGKGKVLCGSAALCADITRVLREADAALA
eukprot:m.11737 g.11737  ORF g.11737 m.11737 type:complete len:284 (+) comp3176_c0_seq1:1113-1964(+)